ncbi:MAG TPA: MarR family transcriptional regulator [Microthrixaceae bacterium]|nr:MarR family transcriptional regulator [Microthrixaceae bacterium]HNI34109.1 MarR family transcriptional regulator [Microthrixaceae bacterium]
MPMRPSPYDVVEASRRVWLERWDADSASGNAVFTAVLRAQQMLMQQVHDVMKAHGLTFARYEVLSWVAVEPESSLALSWISEVLRIPPATVTGLIDRLVDDGLVRRVAHATDARTTLAEITARGRKVADAATVQLNDEVFRPLALAAGEREDIVELLRGLRERSGEFDAERSDELIARLDAQRVES